MKIKAESSKTSREKAKNEVNVFLKHALKVSISTRDLSAFIFFAVNDGLIQDYHS